MAPKSKKSQPPADGKYRPYCSIRTTLYGLCWALIICFTISELGLVSSIMHKYGDDYNNYGSDQYKHAIGILLFSCVFSLLVALSHPWTGIGIATFGSFVCAVFFGTGAGILQRTTPFMGARCKKRTVEEYPERWQPYAEDCKVVVAMQGCAWALWVLYIFLFIGTIVHQCSFTRRATPEGFYGRKP